MNRIEIKKFQTLEYSCEEAINTLCTNLTFSGNQYKKIMVTSCHASEGKSFISMNIMRTMAALGKAVVMVDADLRRSAIVHDYGLILPEKEAPGLTHLLAGMANNSDVLYTTNITGAYIVPVGKTVNNSLPLLNSDRFPALLDYLQQNLDYVIVDAPPIGTLIDAAQIAKCCDGVLMVVGYNSTRKQELLDAYRQVVQTGCPVLGTVINQADMNNYMSRKYYYKSHYYQYNHYYSRYYGPDKPEKADQEKSKGSVLKRSRSHKK